MLSLFFLVVLAFGASHLFPSVFQQQGRLTGLFPFLFAWTELISFSLAFTGAAFFLNDLGSRTANGYTAKSEWPPILFLGFFFLFVTVSFFYASVPIYIGILIPAPLLILIPIPYWIVPPAKPAPPSCSIAIDDACRIRDNVFTSPFIREFMERYPHAAVYLYISKQAYKSGGLFLHNKDWLFYPIPTAIEVTLDCPFTNKLGIFALGREQFCAYLSREGNHGAIVYRLPVTEWNEWLKGMEKKEWFHHIKELDATDPTYPPLKDRPFQYYNSNNAWERFDLMK